MPVPIVRKRAFTPGAALYMPHRATLNDEIFADGRKSDGGGEGETGNVKGPERGNGANEAALKYCSDPLLPRLLRRFYGRVEQWRIPDIIVTVPDGVWGKAQEREENVERNSMEGEEGKRRGGLRAGEKGVALKELVYASGDDHSPLITWTIVQGQRRRHTWEWRRIERENECDTFARLFGSGGW